MGSRRKRKIKENGCHLPAPKKEGGREGRGITIEWERKERGRNEEMIRREYKDKLEEIEKEGKGK